MDKCMRIVVMSDSHRNYNAVEKIVTRNPDADMFIHLGDGEEDVNYIVTKYPQTASRFFHICGNCDPAGSLSPNVLTLKLPYQHSLLACHGHLQGVKSGLGHLIRTGTDNGCDLLLYGHTHNRYMSCENGIYIMNPGSASCPHDGTKPSFGLINISESGILMNIADI